MKGAAGAVVPRRPSTASSPQRPPRKVTVPRPTAPLGSRPSRPLTPSTNEPVLSSVTRRGGCVPSPCRPRPSYRRVEGTLPVITPGGCQHLYTRSGGQVTAAGHGPRVIGRPQVLAPAQARSSFAVRRSDFPTIALAGF